MYGDRPRFRQPMGFGGGAAGPPPRDLLVLLGVFFVTFSLQFFEATAELVGLLELSRGVWQHGFLWQLGTYAFVATLSSGFWFLLELLIIFWFGRDVYRYLGRRQFWLLLAWGVCAASVAAVAIQLLMDFAGAGGPYAFALMQGQRMVLTILIAAFATVYGNATILLFFVLPLKARWFLGLEILFAFMGFLTTKDFAGFLGICVAVGLTYSMLSGRGPKRLLREWRLRLERKILETRLKRMKSRRGMRIVKPPPDDDDKPGGPWVH